MVEVESEEEEQVVSPKKDIDYEKICDEDRPPPPGTERIRVWTAASGVTLDVVQPDPETRQRMARQAVPSIQKRFEEVDEDEDEGETDEGSLSGEEVEAESSDKEGDEEDQDVVITRYRIIKRPSSFGGASEFREEMTDRFIAGAEDNKVGFNSVIDRSHALWMRASKNVSQDDEDDGDDDDDDDGDGDDDEKEEEEEEVERVGTSTGQVQMKRTFKNFSSNDNDDQEEEVAHQNREQSTSKPSKRQRR